MTQSSRPLIQHLTAVIVVKMVLLTAIWWLFIRDAREDVTVEGAASRILPVSREPETTP
jgi:hypothetical protein